MSKQTKFPKTQVLGITVDELSLSEALAHLKELLAEQHRAHYVVKPYVEHMDLAARSPSFKRVLEQAYLCLPDGVSLNWAHYFDTQTKGHWWNVLGSLTKIMVRPLELHLSLPNYSWGTNFSWSLLETAAQEAWTVFIVGSPKHSDIAHTKTFLQKAIPGLQIVGSLPGRDGSGQFSAKLEQQLLAELKQLRPQLVLVGIGMPLQEQVIARLSPKLSRGVLIGEGGTFDYQAFGGRLTKAPVFMQSRGLEWLWRLFKEPGRFSRQLAIPRFIYKVYRHKNRTRS